MTKIIKDKYSQREAEKYTNPIASRECILELFEQSDVPLTLQKLQLGLNLDSPEKQEALRRRLAAMVRDGQLVRNRRSVYGLPSRMDLVTGRIIAHRDGFGFLVPDKGGPDLFISARNMQLVLHEDRVVARVIGVDSRDRREAIIIEVTERNTKTVAGRIIEESGSMFVQPASARLTQDILIPPECRNGALSGQMVVARITVWPVRGTLAVGEVIEVLGDHMAPGMEIDLAIRNHDLPHVWSSAVLSEMKKFDDIVPESAKKNRLDLRHLPFVTIDGEDAKDFDDAVYCERNKKGCKLYVAIADVSHYVLPGSALDKQAFDRGNSVYFPGQVIPMLPEALSNGLCSLNPEVDRLALVCEMHLDIKGEIVSYKFHEAVFKSHARLTYDQVYAMLIDRNVDLCNEFNEIVQHLEELYTTYKNLIAARKKRGSIDFDFPETRIEFGKNRKIDKIIKTVRHDAHRLIEECMLCANICAAKFLVKNKCPGLYRVHRGPSPEKLIDLRQFLGELGLTLAGGDAPKSKDYASLLKEASEREDLNLIQTVLLRSLSQAIYTPENEGHFSLAFDAYAHFTSPIRRYPDLLVHRAIRNILQGEFVPESQEVTWQKFGEHCSMTERRADDATREVVDWLKCEYMLDKVGEVFSGVVCGVTSFGLFVQLTDIFVEGLLHISHLPNDYYHFDAVRHEIAGEKTGSRYRVGKRITIQVARVDLDQRKIDFVLDGAMSDKLSKGRKEAKKKTRKKSKKRSSSRK